MPEESHNNAPSSIAAPPTARREPTPTTLHGITLQDDYRWMRDKSSPEVIAHLEAETAHALAFMAPTSELQTRLYDEMLSHIKETDESVPYPYRGWFYYARTVAGQQYPIHCRKRAVAGKLDETQPEDVLLDVNLLAVGKAFMAVGAMSISPDGNTLAYSTDETGFRQYTLHLRNLKTGEDLADIASRVGSLAWAADSVTLFYTTEDETTKRQDRLFRHRVGSPIADDILVFVEEDERFNLGVGKTRDGNFLMVEAGSHTTNEYRYLAADHPTGNFQLLTLRQDDQEYYPEHRDGIFYIRTNDTGKNFRIVTVPIATPGREHWTEFLPLHPTASLEDFDLFRSFLVTSRRHLGLTVLEVLQFNPDNTLAQPQPIAFPEPTYSAGSHANREFATTAYRYSYTSLVSPASVYEYNVATASSTLLKQQEVPGNFNPALYGSDRVWIAAPAFQDQPSAQVPVSLVYRRDRFHCDSTNPFYVYGYGSYGYPLPVGFSATRLSLLDRGVVLAYAHIRGGGDLGDAWHDAGKMAVKQTTFTDFIAAVEQLTDKGYGDPARIAIEGGSAGGLLLGAVVNLRPDLFRVVLSHVPFVDLMNTMLDASLPLTVAEYEEWGNPNEPDAFHTMLAYSPYDNLKPADYPAMLVKTSLNDSQVMYWEPAKYVAKLRTLKQNDTPLLLHINMDAGHGGASGRYDYLKEIAFDYAFLLTQLGVEG